MGTRPTPAIDKNGIAWLAGEASGDYIASLVLPEVEKRFPGTPQYGVGGPRMRAVNFQAWHDIRELSVRGYVEVLMHLPRLAPDFNLGIEQKLRRRGIPTVHFVSPAIWAWRPERIHQIRRAVDHMLLVFPFEQEIYKRAGIDATYVGHPLAGVIPMKPDTEGARRDYGLMEDSLPVVTVMPGSRIDEVKGCAPAFFGAIEKLLHRFSDMHVLIPAADEAARERIIFIAGQYARLAQHDRSRRCSALRFRDGCARGGALQETHGCGLLDAGAYRSHHAEEGAHSLRIAAQYFDGRKRGAGIPAVLLPRRSDLLGAAGCTHQRREA